MSDSDMTNDDIWYFLLFTIRVLSLISILVHPTLLVALPINFQACSKSLLIQFDCQLGISETNLRITNLSIYKWIFRSTFEEWLADLT